MKFPLLTLFPAIAELLGKVSQMSDLAARRLDLCSIAPASNQLVPMK
ncbi:hypothetical protein GGD67_002906 [Bradyrhizobium sp. IAR9]|nr:hypothetical protein [Bradyrhizobium sp. IAR9]NYG45448.1 hypothetical protein [Bradyrhizobium sp. IAR9]